MVAPEELVSSSTNKIEKHWNRIFFELHKFGNWDNEGGTQSILNRLVKEQVFQYLNMGSETHNHSPEICKKNGCR